MKVELELAIDETDEIKVMQKVMDLAAKAKRLGFSIKELEIENDDDEEDEDEDEEEEGDEEESEKEE